MIRLHPFTTGASGCQTHLRILGTSDLHVHIFPFDYYNDHPTANFGLARTASMIAEARNEVANSILVDNGDFLQGSPIGDYVAYYRGLNQGDLHPIIGAMNLLRYDAATLGNHEFNYGLIFLERTLARAGFPVVCANAVRRRAATPLRDAPYMPPYVILDRTVRDGDGRDHPIRIGITGFLPPQTVSWDCDHLLGNLETRDITATARAWVPQMKEEGADIILALAHSGIGSAKDTDGLENASVPLARTKGIDAVVSGHTHQVFPSPEFADLPEVDVAKGTISGKPAVMPGFWGSHLGVIDLLLEKSGKDWKVVDTRSEARPLALRDSSGTLRPRYKSAAIIRDATNAAHKATLNFMRRQVGESTQDLHSYFALIADSPAVQLVCAAQAWYVKHKLAGSDYDSLPLLSAAAPFKAGGWAGPDNYTHVRPGRVELRNVADLYSFPNTIRAVRITGREIADWLEKSAALFNRLAPDQPDQLLLSPKFPSYQFDVIAGLTYEIDPARPAGYSVAGELTDPTARRIRNLRYRDRPLTPDQVFVVATNSYRVGTTRAFSGSGSDAVVYQSPTTNRDIVRRYIAEQKPLPLMNAQTWRLRLAPGTTCLFDSSPQAQNYLHELPDMQIAPAGPGPDGFARFRITGQALVSPGPAA